MKHIGTQYENLTSLNTRPALAMCGSSSKSVASFYFFVYYFINILLTIKMMNDSYYNNSTLSCFVSFVLLVLMKLYNSMTVAYQSVKNDKMMSAYMSEFVSFNVLDEDYVKSKELLLDRPEENKDESEEVDIENESEEVDIEDILPTVQEEEEPDQEKVSEKAP